MNDKVTKSTNENVHKKVLQVMQELSAVGISKDRKNQMQGYNFRGIDEVLNALAPILSKVGLVIYPQLKSVHHVERETSKGGVMFICNALVDYHLTSADDGSEMIVSTAGEAQDSADKSTNKAMSAAYKYMAIQTFCIPTEGDNDADATTPDPIKYAPKVRQVQPHKETGGAGVMRTREENLKNDVTVLGGSKTMDELQNLFKFMKDKYRDDDNALGIIVGEKDLVKEKLTKQQEKAA